MADTELDRFAAQRKALSTMLARFTADRDSLITSIQECQEQLSSIVSRIDNGSGESVQLGEVQRLIERMQQDQARVDAASERFTEVTALLERLEGDRDAHAAALQRYDAELSALLGRIDALQAGVAQIDDLRGSIEATRADHESMRVTAEESMRRAVEPLAEGLRRLEAAAANNRQTEKRADAHALAENKALVERLTSENAAISSTLEMTQRQVSQLGLRVKGLMAAAGKPAAADVQEQLAALQGEHRRATADLQGGLAQALECMSDAVARLQQLETSHARFVESAEDGATRTAALQDAFGTTVGACQEQVADLARRFDAAFSGEGASLDELGTRLEALRGEQQALAAQARAEIDRVRSETAALVQQAEAGNSEQSTRVHEVENATTRLLAQQDVLAVQLETLRQELAAIAAATPASTALERDIAGLRQDFEVLQTQQKELATSVRSGLSHALQQATETAERLAATADDLNARVDRVGDLAQRFEANADSERRLAGEQETLARMLADCRGEIAELTGRMAAVTDAMEPRFIDFESRFQHLDALRAELQAQTEQSLGQALGEANATFDDLGRRLQEHAQHLDLAAQERADQDHRQQQLDDLIAGAQHDIAELTRRFEAVEDSRLPQLDALQRQVAELHSAQQESAQRTDRALNDAVAAARSVVERVEALAAAPRAEAGIETLVHELAADQDRLQVALREVQQRLDAHLAKGEDGSIDDLRQSLESLRRAQLENDQQLRADMERAGARAAEALHHAETATAAQRAHEADAEALTKLMAEQETALQAALQQCREEIDALAQQRTSDAIAPRVEALCADLRHLQAEVTVQQNEARSALAAVATNADAAVQRLSKLEETLLVNDAADNARQRFEADIVESVQKCRDQLDAVAQRLHGQAGGVEALDERVRELVAAEQSQTHDSIEAARATADRAFTAVEGLRPLTCDLQQRVEQQAHDLHALGDLTSAQRERDAKTLEALHRLSEEREALHVVLQEFQQQLVKNTERIDSSDEAARGAVERLRADVEQTRQERAGVEADIRGTAAAALARADDAVQAVEGLRPLTDSLRQQTDQQARELQTISALASTATAALQRLDALETVSNAALERSGAIELRLADEAAARAAAIQQCEERLLDLAHLLEASRSEEAPYRLELQADLRRLQQQLADTQRQASGGLDEVQTRLVTLAQRIHDATASQSDALGQLHDEWHAVRHDQQVLRQGLTEAQEQTRALAQQASERAEAGIAELRRYLEEMQRAQDGQHATTAALATQAQTDAAAAHEQLRQQRAEAQAAFGRHAVRLSELDTRVEQLAAGGAVLAAQLHADAERRELAQSAAERDIDTVKRALEDLRRERSGADEELRQAVAATRVQSEQAEHALQSLRNFAGEVHDSLAQVRTSAAHAHTSAESAVRAVEALRPQTEGLRQQVDELSLVQAQTDQLAVNLSRLEARLAPRKASHARGATSIDVARRRPPHRNEVWHRFGPALVASLFIVATLGTALFVTPGHGPLSKLRDLSLSRPAGQATVAGLDDPLDAAAFDRGVEALRRGAFVEAEADFREVIRHVPTCVEARNNLAAALVEQHRLEAAAEQLREALAQQPDYTRGRANLAHVEELLAASRSVVSPTTAQPPSAKAAPVDSTVAAQGATNAPAAKVAETTEAARPASKSGPPKRSKPATAKRHRVDDEDDDLDFDSVFDAP